MNFNIKPRSPLPIKKTRSPLQNNHPNKNAIASSTLHTIATSEMIAGLSPTKRGHTFRLMIAL
ncbi:MAG: hypothetical protein ACKO4S_09375 [Snowella sp.]